MAGHKDRAHALLSASSAHRWLECPPSATAAELYPTTDTEYTREGTLAHEVAERYARAPYYDYVDLADLEPEVTQEMVDCAEGYCEYIQEQIEHDSAVVLYEQRVDFSPWVPEGFGTCDCLILQGNTLHVIDYKYGKGVAVDAQWNPQIMLYALGALNDYGAIYDIEHIVMHIYQPRLNNVSRWELPVLRLMEWGDEHVRAQARLAYRGEGDYSAGTHCRFCPHAGRCPELMQSCTEFVRLHDIEVGVPVLPPERISEALAMEPVISLWLKRVKDAALSSLLDGKGIPGYKVVEGRAGARKWLDEVKTAEVLTAAGCRMDEITETRLLSPAAMEKSLGRKRAAELMSGLTERTSGAPTVVPESDKRPPYDRLAEAQKDFEEVVE